MRLSPPAGRSCWADSDPSPPHNPWGAASQSFPGARTGGLPKSRGTNLGVPLIIRTIVFGGFLGSPYLEKLPRTESLAGLLWFGCWGCWGTRFWCMHLYRASCNGHNPLNLFGFAHLGGWTTLDPKPLNPDV